MGTIASATIALVSAAKDGLHYKILFRVVMGVFLVVEKRLSSGERVLCAAVAS